jgi:hypothetical protein
MAVWLTVEKGFPVKPTRRNRKFESISLQRRVCCEPKNTAYGFIARRT